MPSMTPRERLFAALEGRSTDRVPVWLLFPYHATGYYVDVRHHPAYRPLHDLALDRCVTLNRRNLRDIPLFGRTVRRSTEATSGHRRHRLQWPGGDIAWPEGTPMLTTDAALEQLCAVPIETDAAVLHPALERWAATVRAERAEFPEQAGAMMLDLGEPIGFLYHNANLEALSVWSLTHRDAVAGLLDRLMERFRVVYRYALERDLAEVFFLVGSELAAPPLVGLETFERWIVPYARELIGTVRDYGGKTIQHYHGQLRAVLPGFRAMGADALHTVEAPPVGNCTFTQAYAALGDGITLIGNIQYDDFRACSEEALRAAVREVLDECRGRRLILSPTAGPYDPAPSATFLRNLRAFVDEAWRAGPWDVTA